MMILLFSYFRSSGFDRFELYQIDFLSLYTNLDRTKTENIWAIIDEWKTIFEV